MNLELRQLFRHWTYQLFAPGTLLRKKYEAFKQLLEMDRNCLKRIAELEELYYGTVSADWNRVTMLTRALSADVEALTQQLMRMRPGHYLDLPDYRRKIEFYVAMQTEPPEFDFAPPYSMTLADAHLTPELVGHKAARLSSIAEVEDLPVPGGFVITTNAFHYFIEYNELRPQIETLLSKVTLDSPGFVMDIAEEIQRIILDASVPPAVEQEYRDHALALASSRGGMVQLAVRSSAVGEDTEASFAGQYDSVLNVSLSDLSDAYKKVLASKYSAKAISYRVRYGMPDMQTPMAALVLEMIDARASGVLYTRDPAVPEKDILQVYSIEGMARPLVDGSSSPEIITLDHNDPSTVLFHERGGGAPQVISGDVPVDEISLTEDHARTLGGWGVLLENAFGAPQDIEWCMDRWGSLFLIQCRPLQSSHTKQSVPQALPDVPHPAIAEGVPASAGIGIGTVYRPSSTVALDTVPQGAVLVADTLSPNFASVMENLAAVVTDTGSSASHFASVAREFGLPVVVNAKFATRILKDGETVTVNGEDGRVYSGSIQELEQYAAQSKTAPSSPFHARLNRVMKYVSPLHLTDPEAEDFSPAGCRTMHDIVRFCHETAVTEMFNLVNKSQRGLSGGKLLQSGLPLVLRIIDLGGGLTPQALHEREVTACHFASDSLNALWEGLNHPDIQWDGSLLAFDWEEFDRVSAGVMSLKSKTLSSYILVGHEYMHALIRFGYHFAVIDSMVTQHPDSNYINFRFMGGGADISQRRLRLSFVDKVLSDAGFSVHITGELLEASLQRGAQPQMELNLTLLGTLLGKTRLMDMVLTGDDQVQELVDSFMDSI
ncbi:PEP/pyruvate-binding domain-containing protein [Desulfobaculum bizertense]|uniref:Phosphoenolpyruvate synthase n=1 Tax=Desulfobaculum bizertense DSM 18034 TaxID=1121442 RepID=A0A1T4VD33_9BACT|nr:PEP/pyruvate-binding domain-containing protein [Desulfobaculum bizertense]SKA62806.1 pyruvate, water dikinase [Desulfobaculum bizertense DSM 18034]